MSLDIRIKCSTDRVNPNANPNHNYKPKTVGGVGPVLAALNPDKKHIYTSSFAQQVKQSVQDKHVLFYNMMKHIQ